MFAFCLVLATVVDVAVVEVSALGVAVVGIASKDNSQAHASMLALGHVVQGLQAAQGSNISYITTQRQYHSIIVPLVLFLCPITLHTRM